MKRFSILCTLALLLILPASYGQREDNIWVFGYDYDPTTPLAEGIYFNFEDSLKVFYYARRMSIQQTNTSICSRDGHLILYSNGCYIEKADGSIVPGSHGLNPGSLYNLSCAYGDGYRLENSMLLLPDPNSANLFHFFHIPLVAPQQAVNLLYTLVDISVNHDQGKTIIKNQIIVSDTFHRHGLHAVRHANGRDWWIVAAKRLSNRYYLILLSPEGIKYKHQDIGPVDTGSVFGGEMAFSPDGTKLARFDSKDDLRIFDFDRCTGALSNSLHVRLQNDADVETLAGLAWAADSRFLYISENKRILQYDTYAADIGSSGRVVATQSSPTCFLGESFGTMELGPDGIIYCRPFNGQKCMHRIKHPERAGTASLFEHNYFVFDYPYNGLPHFPNFRLGPVDGSACDTLDIDNLPLAHWRHERASGLTVDFVSVSWYNPEWYHWDFGDPGSGLLNYSSEKYPSHEYPGPGPYEVCLTVGNKYGTDTKCKTVWVLPLLSTGEGFVGELGRLYPSPSSGQLYWSGDQVVRVRLFSAAGQLLLDRVLDGGTLLVGHLPEGFYVAQVFDAQTHALLSVQKVVLRR